MWVTASLATIDVAPAVFSAFMKRPLAWLATALFLAGLVTSALARRQGRDLFAFIGSGAFLLGLLGATAACVYPVMLKSATDPERSLTALNASASEHALGAALLWWPVGFVIAIAYVAIVFRLHRGKVSAGNAVY
jgi:cytochrome d ubiquinol oxidase subunit II